MSGVEVDLWVAVRVEVFAKKIRRGRGFRRRVSTLHKVPSK